MDQSDAFSYTLSSSDITTNFSEVKKHANSTEASTRRQENPFTIASLQSQVSAPVVAAKEAQPLLDIDTQRKLARSGQISPRGNNRFAPGQCTDYVARQTGWVTWTGNANRWGANAGAQGYPVGKEYAAPGTIIQTNENPYYGHVGYVIKVEGDMITFREWNYKGKYIETERTLNINSPKVITIIANK